MKRILMIALILLTILMPTSSRALMRVIGSVAVPENSKSIVLTRENHSPKVYTGMIPQSTFDNAFRDNPSLIAYVVYPNGPSYTISDELVEDPVDLFRQVADFDQISQIIESKMFDAGYETCEAKLIEFGDSFLVSILCTRDEQAIRSITAYYQSDMSLRRLVFTFIAYDNIPIWNQYSINFLRQIDFRVSLLEMYPSSTI